MNNANENNDDRKHDDNADIIDCKYDGDFCVELKERFSPSHIHWT